ncbi:MAG: DUF2541 family protein [Bacteroidetes bacterium]|nr:DUF2541 family protein [Bacteroidota bacterium]
MKVLFKTPITAFLLISFIALSGMAFTPVSMSTDDCPNMEPPRWEKLGQRKVNRGLDHDEIFVTARDGRFSKIKLKVRKSGINMHRLVLHFGNGTTQEVNVRNNIPAGGETRVIDIKGGKRILKKAVFFYDTKGIINNKATVELWGRH